MKVTRNSHTNDLIELTRNELENMLNNNVGFVANGVEVQMLRKPDVEYTLRTYQHSSGSNYTPHLFAPTEIFPANIKLVFDGDTGALKKAEVL